MPTKFTLHKWLCDECPQLYDTEPDCHVHARQVHKHSTSDLHALEQICARIDATSCNAHELVEYERVCNAVVKRVDAIKNAQAMAQRQQFLTIVQRSHDVLAVNEFKVGQIGHNNEDTDVIEIDGTDELQSEESGVLVAFGDSRTVTDGLKTARQVSRKRHFPCNLSEKTFRSTRSSYNTDRMKIRIDENNVITDEPAIENVDNVTTPDTHSVRNAKNCSSSMKIFACDFDACTKTFYTHGGLRQHTRFVHKHQQPLPLCANFKW
ncbi:unnamed protein product [Sphagnum balticum]